MIRFKQTVYGWHFHFFSPINSIEGHFSDLKTESNNAFNNHEPDKAIAIAAKLAANFGVAGILAWYEVMYKVLSSLKEKNELIEVDASKLLRWIYVAKDLILIQKDEASIKSMLDLDPNNTEFQSLEFWDGIETAIFNLLNIDSYERKQFILTEHVLPQVERLLEMTQTPKEKALTIK